MRRHNQDIKEIKSKLSIVDSDWKDEFAEEVITQLELLDTRSGIDSETIKKLLSENFKVGITVLRLFLEKSKDEFNILLRQIFDKERGLGKKFFENDPNYFVEQLSDIDLISKINESIQKKYTWKDIIIERLKAGRGSAIKGQFRGRSLEDFVQERIDQVFSSFDIRCNFIGEGNNMEAKADFAIPSKTNPSIVIEVKAYGATGSKQTDSLGDVEKIINNKRHDTYFLFVTDGVSWLDRMSDLKKIIRYQNEGYIYRIYTQQMEAELLEDLIQMKKEINLY